MYPDLGLLILRAFLGMVVIAHGLQKFGFLGGYGIAGTAGWLESIGFAPAGSGYGPWPWLRSAADADPSSGLAARSVLGFVAADLAVASIGFHARMASGMRTTAGRGCR